MDKRYRFIIDRNTILINRLPELLGSHMQLAHEYLSSDPGSSLTKSRIVLEKLLLVLYRDKMKKEPLKPMIGNMLTDKEFSVTIPQRILVHMKAIKDMANLGAHGENIMTSDAILVMQHLMNVMEWYTALGNPNYQVPTDNQGRQSLDILPQLKSKYKEYLRPEITSVKFIQSQNRCYLEITTSDSINSNLIDETSHRTDLAFISSDTTGDGLLFSPATPITENANHFLADFDVVSIINCTDLFTPEAAKKIDDCWQQHGQLLNNV